MVVLLDTMCVFTCVWGPLKLVSGEVLVGLLTETSWRQHSELPVQLTWILNVCYVFFRLLPKILDFAASYFQPGAKYYSAISLSQQKPRAMNLHAITPNCKYPYLVYGSPRQNSVYGLCLCGKEIFEKLSLKKNSSLFWTKGVSKIKIIFIKAGPSHMKFLIVFTPLVEKSWWPANWN